MIDVNEQVTIYLMFFPSVDNESKSATMNMISVSLIYTSYLHKKYWADKTG